MGWLGSALGSLAGQIGSKVLPIPGVDGGQLGGFLGGLAPFRKGGMVPRANAKIGGIPVALVPKKKVSKPRVQKRKK